MGAEEMVGKIVSTRFSDGSIRGVGIVYAATSAPTVAIRLADGSMTWWRADMCRVEVDDPEICNALIPFVSKP